MSSKIGASGLVAQASAYTFALFLLRAGNFLLVPVYTSLLTTAEYGLVGVLQQIVAVLATAALCGQQTAALQLGLRSESNPEERQAFFSTQWTFVVGLGLVLTLLAVAVWPWVDPLLGGVPLLPLGLAALLGVGGQASFLLQLAWRQQAGRAREHVSLSLSRWATMLLLSLGLVLGLRWGATGILLAQSLSYWLGTGLGFRIRATEPDEHRPPVPVPRLHIDRTQLRSALRFGLPVLPHALAGVAFVTTDRTLLAAHHGAETAGIYTLAVSLSSAVLLLGQGLHSAWAPFFLRIDREGATDGLLRARSLSFFILCALAGTSCWLGLLAPEIISVMAPASYAAAAAIVPVLAGTTFIRGYYQVVVAVVLAEASTTRWLALTTVPAAVLNLVLNAFWIPRYGVSGAVAAMFITYGLSSLGAAILARRARKVPFKYGRAILLLPMLGSALWLGDGLSLGARIVIGLGFTASLVLIDLRDVGRELGPLLAKVRLKFIG